MIAEIKGKISSANSNLTDRSEDELTGNFFGNLRYLPFDKGMKHILKCCKCSNDHDVLSAFNARDTEERWPDCVSFWPREQEAEPDVLLVFDKTVALIEVKYQSGLSSDDDVDNRIADDMPEQERGKSRNQLAREGELLKRIAGGRKKVLILLAPESVAGQIHADVINRENLRELFKDVQFSYITWQSAFDALQDITDKTKNPAYNSYSRYEMTVVNDLIDLLRKKGFERFRNFECSIAVDVSETWKFDYSVSCLFSFLVEKNVRKGEYYEFG